MSQNIEHTGDSDTKIVYTVNNISYEAGGTVAFRHNATGLIFFGGTPVAQPSHIADPIGGSVVDIEARIAIASLLAQMATLGLQASS